MKKVVFTLGVVMGLGVLMGADIRGNSTAKATPVSAQRKPCAGYTIVEFGKAIDCNGDTLRLVKVDGGGQQILREPS